MSAPGVYEGAANVIAALMLLLEFGMLRQALVRDQVRLYAAQSALISVLAVVIAADRGPAGPVRARRAVGGAKGGRRAAGAAPPARQRRPSGKTRRGWPAATR